MSLDLTITTTKIVRHVSTGVFIRENGHNVELETMKEVRRHFPGFDISNVREREYFDNRLWSMNITHNLCEMAEKVVLNDKINLYKLLWRPKENGFVIVNKEYIDYINEALEIIKANKKDLELFNPKRLGKL